MEPFEWLVLGIGFVLGGIFGAKGKGVVKTAAKGYLAAGEKAQEWSANLREDFRDAVEEARYEREQEEAARREELEASEPANRLVTTTSKPAGANSTRKSSGSSSGAGASHTGAKPAE
jgi:predicted phage gp36 major capsid-like protein